MRLVTWNVRSLKQDRAAVVAVLRALEPDVVALQEAPKWWRGAHRLRRLAADSGLEVAVPAGVLGARTCAVLVRADGSPPGDGRRPPVRPVRVVSWRAVRLRLRVTGRQHWYPTLRGAALAVVRPADGPDVVVASVHLSLDPRERAEHLGEVVAAVRAVARGAAVPVDRVVVAGDLNEPPGGEAWRALADAGWRDLAADDAPTFSTTSPRRRLDAVLAGSTLSGAARRVGGEGAQEGAEVAKNVSAGSDHFPVVADLVLLPRA
ncbi:endonuclease/exonuclease/phosphatase family protein [Luteimicrobium subarcticum]|uniref:Endonuclease/exonuclease/phosphatase family metal-dependent hydrolase n=1 Tax=Luteimicrobium subarcticum TaxID=620910 RepID=A0A2M8WSG4_9MICO|nr:endonuclease/exonuclease/phosphatase family protein [Luteimicrobium subarcticum]PJI93885.1 endonuclease/exonuclease/phosphatase family metal-dependent hydrolase [Luteimicrobium subarcticum]